MKAPKLGRMALLLGLGYPALLALWTMLVVELPSPTRALGDPMGAGLLLAFLAGPVVHLAGMVLAILALIRESSRPTAVVALLLNLVAGMAEAFLIVGFWAAATRWN